MPFTISHPAIVLPLALLPKRYVSLTGLVIGSMSPDFEYFLRMRLQSDYSHTIEGVFYFDLPLTIILAFLFHNLVRNYFINNLPLFLRKRFIIFTDFNWNTYFIKKLIVIVISIIIGAFSHLFWDSFTHFGGYFVEQIPMLKNTVRILNYDIPVLKLLQHSSTIVGALIIGIFIYSLKQVEVIKQKSNKFYWVLIIALTIIILGIRLLNGLSLNEYGNIIVTTVSAFMIALIVSSMILKQKFRNI